jgi:DNA polymerase III epsilon subunit-like protein
MSGRIFPWSHPKRDNSRPVWDWTNACWNAMLVREAIVAGDTTYIASEVIKHHEQFQGIVGGEQFLASLGHVVEDQEPQILTLVFDTETTDTSKAAQIIQMAYVIIDQNGHEVESYNRIWYSDRPVQARAYRVHMISTEKVQSQGVLPQPEISDFIRRCDEVRETGGKIVAHNLAFDSRMLRQTCTNGREIGTGFCTMKGTKKVHKSERGETYKNGDVYSFITGKKAKDVHDALSDARMTAAIYTHVSQNGWWEETLILKQTTLC